MTIRKYKSGWILKKNKKFQYYLYKKGEPIVLCDDRQDAYFMHWCLTH